MMERLILCLTVICVAAAQPGIVGPRGARPVEPNTRDEKCATESNWPFCTDDEWGPKCPSGCRIQGLMDKHDHEALKRIEKIRLILSQNEAQHRSADQVSKDAYDYLREKLQVDSGKDNDYYDLALNLRQRITEMKIKIDRQLRILGTLKNRVKDQVTEMQRLEVDIDMKLRACKGSCAGHTDYNVDRDSYVALDKQMNQLDTQSAQSVETVGTLYVMKSLPLRDALVDDRFKSKDITDAGQQRTDFFSTVKVSQLLLEQEGSSTSPATISKDSGTSLPSSSSSTTTTTTSSSSSSSNPSITELGGHGLSGGFENHGGSTTSTSTQTFSCTRTIQKVITHTKDGPVETTEEVMVGGPECQAVTHLTQGGLAGFFPSHGSSSSSSSSSSSTSSITTKTVDHSKGGLVSTKTTIGDPFSGVGFDLGLLRTDATEEDTPEIHARSVKSTRVERDAHYVGKDCADIQQKHLNGEMNGVFKVKPGGLDSAQEVEVYCRQEGLMGGWLLVQQREGGALNFNRTWAEYRSGFGSIDAEGKGELWLGNQNLHLLTNQSETMLKVELEDWEGGMATAEYIIRVGSEAEGYTLHVSGYIGDAGDALVRGDVSLGQFLSPNGMKFSTFDRDNDKREGASCAEMYGGGWWYNNCRSANLNGIYYKGSNTPYEIENGVVWVTYKPADYSLKNVRMFIRPAAF